jgi:hypothetical protein
MLHTRQGGSIGVVASAAELVDEVCVFEFTVVEQHVGVGVGCHRERPLSDAGSDERPRFALAVPEAYPAMAQVMSVTRSACPST